MRSNTFCIVSPPSAFGSSSTSAFWWKAGPPTLMTITSQSEASCQACPPWASGVMPAALSLAAAVSNCSQVAGIVMPTFFSTAGLAYIQSSRCTLTGAATHWPLYFMVAATDFGSACSHLPAAATSSMGCSTPSAPHSWISGPLSCTDDGASPPSTRARSLVSASSLLPPPTGVSIHLPPCDSMSSLSDFIALAWPPEVIQCSTSTVGAADTAVPLRHRPTAHAAPLSRLLACLIVLSPRAC